MKNIETIELNKNYLTNAEVNALVITCVELSTKKGDFDNYRFSPLTLHTAFYKSLMNIVVKDYNDDEYEDYYSGGIHKYLIDKIDNAYDAFVLLKDVYEEMRSVSNIIDINIMELKTMLEEKIPDKKVLNKWINKLPEVKKSFDEISQKHEDIMSNVVKK